MVQGQVFLKGVVGTFPIYFFQRLSLLHLEIFIFEEILFFSATMIL